MLSSKSLSALLAITLRVWEPDEKSLTKTMNCEETSLRCRLCGNGGQARIKNIYVTIFLFCLSSVPLIQLHVKTMKAPDKCLTDVHDKQLNESRGKEILTLIKNCQCKILVFGIYIYQDFNIKAALVFCHLGAS